MTKSEATSSLKKPANNRGVSFDFDEITDEVILDGNRFMRWVDAEDYLESKTRLDIPSA
jgi:hypothetical protein